MGWDQKLRKNKDSAFRVSVFFLVGFVRRSGFSGGRWSGGCGFLRHGDAGTALSAADVFAAGVDRDGQESPAAEIGADHSDRGVGHGGFSCVGLD